MKTWTIGRASLVALGVSAALAANSAWAQVQDQTPQTDAESEGEELGVITVTGSRTITEAVRSPTPITSVDIGAIAVTTPSDIADALNKLPNILGGRTPRNQGNASTNNGGNTLSLRNFGPSRTLVLLNGHRVAPNNQDGSVNIDTLPQMLMERVDIVTGGASAVYGSDAVAGVVNFVLDKDFTGFSFKSDYGKSKYGDGEEYQLGAAWGTSLFSDRGHFEVAARTRHQDMIPQKDRPYAENGQSWLLTGNGSPTAPFTNTPYSRIYNSGVNGNIQCGAACGFNNHTFQSDGTLRPLIPGTPTNPVSAVQSGGEGAYIKYGTFRSEVEMKDIFARFSLDLGDTANWYVQGSWAQAENASDWIQWVVSPNANRPNAVFANNPYLTTATQQLLGSTIVCGTPAATGWRCLPGTPPVSPQTGTSPPPPPAVPFFTNPRYLNTIAGLEANAEPNRLYRTLADQKTWNAETGVTGELGSFSWDVYYNHGVSELTVTNPNNTSNAKYLAALDAVDVGGTIQCWVSTQPQFAGLYPGCVPMNIVGPNGPSAEAYNYLRTSTSWLLTQELDDVGFSIGGGLWGLGLPAGEIVANFSGEYRWATYVMESDFLPTDFVNCTGLRLCLAGGTNNAPVLWVQNTNAPVDAKNHVYEGALELNIPLLKETTGFQDLSTNLAYRWTKYSTFDAVDSWKLGLNWQVVDSVRFRSTLSSDIRAPNLNDLFQPAGITSTSYNDRLTGGSSQGMRLASRGNPLLTPEEAKTFTAGVVLTPSFIPRFILAVDFYETRLTNAITGLNYANDNVQAVCLASAPAYDSPVCDLAVRPITDPSDPNYLNPAVNMPTEVRNAPANAALQKTKGYDLQLDYSWDMGGGQFAVRHLASYQPTNSTLTTKLSTFYTWAVQPKLMQTTFLSYHNADWTVSLQNRWLSSISLKTSDNDLNGSASSPLGTQYYADSNLDHFNVIDTTISKEFEISNGNMEAFLTVNNLMNERAPLFPSASGLPGLFYPTLGIHDDMGRYYTAGVRLKF
jgi:iron complex outermembrane recepter protein